MMLLICLLVIQQKQVSCIFENNIGKRLKVLLSVIPSIKVLEPWMYQLILKPMVEGIMFEIQDSVPSETDGKLGNLQYQRFFNAKKELKLKLPQMESIVTKQVGSNINRVGEFRQWQI